MSTHTPGPWELKGDILKQCGPKGLYLARIDEGAGLGNAADANARLIAAAPDLLAALKSLVVNDGRILGVNLGALKPAVERAIAKAEGTE